MTRAPRLLVLLVVCAAAGYLAGKAFWPGPQPAQPPPAPAPRTSLTRLPDFSLEDLATGQRRSIGDWSDQAVLLNFWASWCDPCRDEAPAIEGFARRNRGKLVVVGMDSRDLSSDAERFVDEYGLSYDMFHDGEGEVMDSYKDRKSTRLNSSH